MPREISRAELNELYAYAENYFLAQDVSPGKAFEMAVEWVYQETGHRPQNPNARKLYEAAQRAPSRCHTEKPARGPSRRCTEEPMRETRYGTEYDRMFQHQDRDAARTSGKTLSVEEIKDRATKIINDLLDKGANEDYARQQGEKFFFREMGKRNTAREGANGARSQSARSEYNDHGAYRISHGRAHFARSEYDAHGTSPEPRYDTSHIYSEEQLKAIMKEIYESWIEKGVHPDEARQEAKKWYGRYCGNRDREAVDDEGYSGRSSGSSGSGSTRGPRSGMSRPPGWEDPMFDQYFTDEPIRERFGFKGTRRGYSSSFGGDGAYDDEPPRRSRTSRGSPRGYFTEERRPGGFSSSSYGPKDTYNGYDDRSHWHGPRSGHGQPPMEPSGVKPGEDLYLILGVPQSATAEEIKQAHRKLCIKHHPDRVKGGLTAKMAATERMAQINQACDVLKNDEMRAFYDRTGLIASMGQGPDAP